MKESEFEKRFLDFVYRTQLAITPSALAYHTGIPIAEADAHLKALVGRDVVKLDVEPNGDLVYSFPNRERVVEKNAQPAALPLVSVVSSPATHALSVLANRPAAAEGQETIPCPFCGEAIRAVAKKCKHCNEMLDPALRLATGPPNTALVNFAVAPPAVYRQRGNPGVAALLSFLWPGAGHIYCGEVGAGIGWMMATFVGYVAFIIPGIILHICCIVAANNTAKGVS